MQTSDDGWTYVGKSKGRRRTTPHVTDYTPPSQDMTITKIQADLDSRSKVWRSSKCRASILEVLDRGEPAGGWKINNAICLAVGSFSRENFEGRRRTMYQFAVFMDLVQHLRAHCQGSIQLYAQEPRFTDLDQEFLHSLGFTILEVTPKPKLPGLGPAADMLCPKTFLYEPFMEVSMETQKCIAAAGLGLYVGSSMGSLDKFTENGQADLATIQLLEDFERTYYKYQFERFEEEPHVFEGLSTYYRMSDQILNDIVPD